MLSVNISDIAIIIVKNVDCCIIHNISKSEAINSLKNPALGNPGYMCVCVCVCVYIYIYKILSYISVFLRHFFFNFLV